MTSPNEKPVEAAGEMVGVSRDPTEVLRNLSNNVRGIWRIYGHELRAMISNTNYAVVADALEDAAAVLATTPRSPGDVGEIELLLTRAMLGETLAAGELRSHMRRLTASLAERDAELAQLKKTVAVVNEVQFQEWMKLRAEQTQKESEK